MDVRLEVGEEGRRWMRCWVEVGEVRVACILGWAGREVDEMESK